MNKRFDSFIEGHIPQNIMNKLGMTREGLIDYSVWGFGFVFDYVFTTVLNYTTGTDIDSGFRLSSEATQDRTYDEYHDALQATGKLLLVTAISSLAIAGASKEELHDKMQSSGKSSEEQAMDDEPGSSISP